MNDEQYMKLALKLAQERVGQTSPNPMVGALVVDQNGEIAGRGAYEKRGAEHAEVIALREAGARARGATLYVTLEPCSHHGRTPPCVDAIIAGGIARVVSAMEDPDARVRGAGFAKLRSHNVNVEVGLLGEQAARTNRMYVHHRTTGRPFVTLKMAQSLDGAIAARAGERRQLTGKPAARYTRMLRYEHDAVMVGVGTVLVDDPLLTVRPNKPRALPYRRIVVDARGRIPLKSKITKDQVRAGTIVATTELMPATTREALVKRGVSVLECARSADDRVDIHDMLAKLASNDIISILCEGGPTLGTSLLSGGHVNEVNWLIAPMLLGGPEAVPVIGNMTRELLLRLQTVRRLGDDVLVAAEIVR
ncbi:MAG TPA: bifunctional diaminohydroxyphosphoribosylaminopyrimidine deaminase/5-amino-6-(5-phosphoribosylamino)uracil reductase RibD [Candidatus Acidoferrales bacterium]|nr:bifunctional diaminohydroxyphosphoribosylaminopyrimidine deaminase/5-amino-6-(5-phosphoribosylamino)uracil reductase RibD [Candidatus Acidoferrales bacterium]